MQSYMSYFTSPKRESDHRPFRRSRPEDFVRRRGPSSLFHGPGRRG